MQRIVLLGPLVLALVAVLAGIACSSSSTAPGATTTRTAPLAELTQPPHAASTPHVTLSTPSFREQLGTPLVDEPPAVYLHVRVHPTRWEVVYEIAPGGLAQSRRVSVLLEPGMRLDVAFPLDEQVRFINDSDLPYFVHQRLLTFDVMRLQPGEWFDVTFHEPGEQIGTIRPGGAPSELHLVVVTWAEFGAYLDEHGVDEEGTGA